MASSSELHTGDPKNSPGRKLFQGGKRQNAASVRKELRSTEKNGGPRKRM